ncbi:MAG: hypothetical protein ACRC10_00020 [Thermoguttaceae bacterium]
MNSVRQGRDIDAALQRKGFLRKGHGDHIRYYYPLQTGASSTVMTKMSHGMLGQTLSVVLIAKMAQQCRLTKSQFLALIDCSLDADSYRTLLQQQKYTV